MSKEIEVLYITEDDIESCGLWQEDTGTPFIRKSDYDELAKDMSAQATALYDLLTAKLAEAERQLEELRGLRKQEPVAYTFKQEGSPAYTNNPSFMKLNTQYVYEPLYAAPMPPEQTGDALVEGMYQKMWKDFVSLQRGDAKQICVEAELYRKSLTAPIPPTPSQQEALDHLSNLLKYDSSESWVAVKAFILARPDAPIPPDNHDWKAEYLRQVDLHNQTLDELREAEMQLRNPAPTPPTPSQQEPVPKGFIVVSKDLLAEAIACNTDASLAEARHIINSVLKVSDDEIFREVLKEVTK